MTKVLVNTEGRLAEERMPIKKWLGCNNWEALVNLMMAIVATSPKNEEIQLVKLLNVDRA